MKTGIKHSFIVSVLITILGLMLVGRGTAQTFTVLHTFIKSDGGFPHGDLVLSNNTLFGTTQNGGSANNGTVFKVNTDGTGFTNLYSFTNSDGAAPHGGLILASNTLYGTTIYGGASGWGTVFKVNTDGTGFATLYSFTALS